MRGRTHNQQGFVSLSVRDKNGISIEFMRIAVINENVKWNYDVCAFFSIRQRRLRRILETIGPNKAGLWPKDTISAATKKTFFPFKHNQFAFFNRNSKSLHAFTHIYESSTLVHRIEDPD